MFDVLIEKSKKNMGAMAGVAAALGILLNLNPDTIYQFMSNEITKTGFFFVIAAWLHSGRVKKEISKNFLGLTDSINNVASALRQDLERQAKILDNHRKRLETLETHEKLN